MKRISGWEIKLFFDDVFFEFVNFLYWIEFSIRGGASSFGLENNKEFSGCLRGKPVFIVGNGPSLANHDLKKLAGKNSFFVNRGFLLPDYSQIQPPFHVIVDPKLGNGAWPINFLDQILEKNPAVTFLLNAAWFENPVFKPYLGKRIIWLHLKQIWTRFFRGRINLHTLGVGGAVVEQGILSAIYMGAKEIYLIGVDGNGLCYNLIGQASHAYGSNPEDLNKSSLETSLDLYFMSMGIRKWVYLAQYCKRKGIKVYNLNPGGIMHMFERRDYDKVLGAVI